MKIITFYIITNVFKNVKKDISMIKMLMVKLFVLHVKKLVVNVSVLVWMNVKNVVLDISYLILISVKMFVKMDSTKIITLKLVIDVIMIFVKLVKKKVIIVLVVLLDSSLLMVFVLKNVL